MDQKTQESHGDGPASSLEKPPRPAPVWQACINILTYTPHRCRYDPQSPVKFSMALNILFAFAGCFTVANLYYSHPILNLLAQEYQTTDQEASYVPTLAQAGYAVGLFLLNPLGDLVRRRPLVLLLVWFTATVWIGLCLTRNFQVFLALTFVTGFSTVTPQLMMPLVGELAPANRKATALSVVVSGLLLGMLIARLLSGVVALYIGWRYIYWIAFCLQYIILALLWMFMPDYPFTNPTTSWRETVRQYPIMLWDIVRLVCRHPVLAQACLIGLFTSAAFTNFWTTLTFLLAGPPYHYNSFVIGLFALIGIGAMLWGPVFARTFMDKHQPLASVIVGLSICLVGNAIGAYIGLQHVSGPVIQAAFLDAGLQTSQIANRTAIFQVAPKGRNRVNTAYMLGVFLGQLMGTGVGNALYARGGWIGSGSAGVGFVAAALLLCFARGPHEKNWFGWHGGWNLRLERNSHEVDSSVNRTSSRDAVDDTDKETLDNDAKRTFA